MSQRVHVSFSFSVAVSGVCSYHLSATLIFVLFTDIPEDVRGSYNLLFLCMYSDFVSSYLLLVWIGRFYQHQPLDDDFLPVSAAAASLFCINSLYFAFLPVYDVEDNDC